VTIISYSKNFIFLRTRKTASTKAEHLLRKILSINDIATFVYVDLFYNYRDGDLEKTLYNNGKIIFNLGNIPGNFINFYKKLLFKKKFVRYPISDREFSHPHMNIIEIKKRLKNSVFKKMLKVTTIRNPYDTIISAIFSKFGKKHEFKNIEEVNIEIKKNCELFFKMNDIFRDENRNNLINHFIKAEKFEDDFKLFLTKIGINKNNFDFKKKINNKSNLNFFLIEHLDRLFEDQREKKFFNHKLLSLEELKIRYEKVPKFENDTDIIKRRSILNFKKEDLTLENIDLINYHADYIFKLGLYNKM